MAAKQDTAAIMNSHAKSTYNNVKQEQQDDTEIRELAAKFVEANKAKMAIPQRTTTAQQLQSASLNIFNFLNDKTTKKSEDSVKHIDEESSKGRFGWTSMGKVHIPYIIRSGENYCAVRMVEMKVLNKWLSFLHQDLYNCTNIRSYYITDVEARLLNEINLKHCDYHFGQEQFTTRDLIVRLSDANEFYQFLGHCYHKLVNTVEHELPNRCGFIRINRESVVPYTVYNDQKYVPLFYFEGETDNLKLRADKLEGWDLSYLKFCCKVQGIRNELFAHDSCSVISLNDIKHYFPPGTVFEDYWPKKNLDSSQLLISGRTSLPQNVHWTRQPAAPPISSTHPPPPSPKPVQPIAKTVNGPMHNVHVYNSNYGLPGAQSPYHAVQPRGTCVRNTYPASSRHMRPSFYPSVAQPPPPLVRTQTYRFTPSHSRLEDGPCFGGDFGDAIPSVVINIDTLSGNRSIHTERVVPCNAQRNSTTSNYMVVDNQNNYHQTTAQGTYPPPPLLQHMNGNLPRYDVTQSNYGASRSLNHVVNQNPAHQASSRTQTTVSSTHDGGLSNGRLMSGAINNARNKLINLPETSPPPPTASTNIPYKMQKTQVQGKMLSLINMKGSEFREMLVTLQDFVTNFFSGVSLQACQQVLQVLGIEVYKANAGQMQVLMENGKCTNRSEPVPLVQVRNVIDYMPQLKYMLNCNDGPTLAKRQRTS